MLKNNKGITLVALVITIVVMLILAGIAINLTLGENGIFNKAKDAKTEYEAAATNESTMLDNLNADLTANVDGDFE